MIRPIQQLRLMGIFAFVSACGPTEPSGSNAFVSAPSPGFRHDNGYASRYYFPETFGSGVALFDANSDGHLDLYAVQGGPVPGSPEAAAYSGALPTNQLYFGDGTGTLRDATSQAGDAADANFGMGAHVGDVNGDGLPDLFVTNVGADSLLIATGDDLAMYARTTATTFDVNQWSTAAGFADFDRDGHLDLVVVGYARWSAVNHVDCIADGGNDYCDVKMYDGIQDHVFRGDGAGGFSDKSEAWQFGLLPGRGLGTALTDFDDDGFVDIYVANDTEANRYYKNNRGAGFLDHTDLSGTSSNSDGRFEAGMGVAVANISGNGLADIVVTNFTSESNNLFENLGQSRFRERSRLAGIAKASIPKLAFGVTLQDFDLNGQEDLFTACGHVLRHIEARVSTWSWRQSDQLLLNGDNQHFTEFAPGELFETPRVGRGLASGDLDEDGAPDLIVSNSGDDLIVGLNRLDSLRGFANGVSKGDRWLLLNVKQAASPTNTNTSAIGAKVTLSVDDGSVQTRWIRAGTGYLSQDDQRPHFGIPRGKAVSSIQIRWPDGVTTQYSATELKGLGSLNQVLTIRRE